MDQNTNEASIWRFSDREDKRILGQEISGIIEEVGKDVTNYNVGDKILGSTTIFFGGHAEYIALPAKMTSLMVKKTR